MRRLVAVDMIFTADLQYSNDNILLLLSSFVHITLQIKKYDPVIHPINVKLPNATWI